MIEFRAPHSFQLYMEFLKLFAPLFLNCIFRCVYEMVVFCLVGLKVDEWSSYDPIHVFINLFISAVQVES
jgi:hypothetical protein